MNKIIAQIAVLGMMTFAAHARAGEVSAMETPHVQGGRILVSVSDFQKIIQGTDRVLSSESSGQAQEVLSSSNKTIAAIQQMSAEDKAELYKKVLPLARKQAQALSSVMTSLKSQLAKVKSERKAIQAARLSQNQDTKLQEKLFSNLMEESNLEAKIAEAGRQIQESSLLVIEYHNMGSTTELVSVQHGQKHLWSHNPVSVETAIAQN